MPADDPELTPGELTDLLQAWNRGEAEAREQLMPIVYHDLRKRAAGYLKRENRNHTLRPTDLVHETYLRLCEQNSGWRNRDHFFGVAARLMRRILVDHARARAAAKRGRNLCVTLDDALAATPPRDVDILALDDALEELARLDPRQARLVELRFFGGLTQAEAAQAVQVSLATANREWATAKAWLYRRLKRDDRRD
jgi:RNA polymerase sigma factor (TIGR02999 family)